ncbi:MAG: phage BR0599 family protein [Lysobacter sp.]
MAAHDYETSDWLGSRVELFLFETDDAQYRWAYTTDSKPKLFGVTTYEPLEISRGELRQTAENNTERLTVKVPFDNPVALIHVPYLPPRPIRLTIYRYERNDPAAEIVQAFTGYISSFNQKAEWAELECSQVIDTMSQTVPWAVFKSDCIWALYQIGCGVSKAAYEVDVPGLLAVDGDTIQSGVFSGYPDGWFTNGYMLDPGTGEVRFITYHVGNTIRVVHPFTALGGGSPAKLYAGCDRKRQTCSDKFNNRINYVGFDYFPAYNVFQQGIT